MARKSPTWLGQQAGKYYIKIADAIPNLTENQKDLIAVMADSWETYQAARVELQEYADKEKALTVTTLNGGLRPHPAFQIQRQALDTYLRMAKELRISLGSTEQDTDVAVVTELIDEVNDLL